MVRIVDLELLAMKEEVCFHGSLEIGIKAHGTGPQEQAPGPLGRQKAEEKV